MARCRIAIAALLTWLPVRALRPQPAAGEAGSPGSHPASAAASQPATRPARGPTVAQLRTAIRKLRPLHKQLGKPKPGEWLDRFKEPGQTFEQYLHCRPALPGAPRRVLCVQPLGALTQTRREIVERTAEFIGLYFNLPVRVEKDLPLTLVPASARRTHPQWGVRQIRSTYVLDHVLRPRLPKDAAAYIAFTSSDLWPGEGWNFVFGQASLRDRVAVWSLYRNGDPDAGEASFRLCLLRTMKTAAHETGHMFSMQHCTAYECNMCGSNSRAESDRRPIALCPECAAKVCWAGGTDPLGRYTKLAAFCREHGLAADAAFYEKFIAALGQ